MKKLCLGISSLASRSVGLLVFLFLVAVTAQSQSPDAGVMQELKKSINPPASLKWDDPDPCKWRQVDCAGDRVTKIQVGKQGLSGSLPPNLGNLSALTIFEVMENGLTGALPNLAGLASLQRILLNGNAFTSIPPNFFAGMTSLETVSLDNNPFSPWPFPESLKDASPLRSFSAINCSISGTMPDIFISSNFPSLTDLRLSFNSLSGPLPPSFSGSSLQTLWLNGQKGDSSSLNGSIAVLQNMTALTQVWLHSNSFSGPIPDLSGLNSLQDFSVRDNSLTGPVPDSLTKLSSLKVVNLTNNMLQGPTPQFPDTVQADVVANTNSFCLSQAGKGCDTNVNILLAVAKDVGYPIQFAKDWKGNDPCSPWRGITCDNGGISVVNFQKLGLSGTISPNFSSITTLQRLILSNNDLTGNIPDQLTSLNQLKLLDVSNNQLYGKVPTFNSNVKVITDGNVNIGKDGPPPVVPSPGGTPSSPGGGGGISGGGGGGKKSSTGAIVGAVVGGACGVAALAGLFVFCLYRTKRKRSGRVQSPHTMVIHPRHSGSEHDAVKITIAGSSATGGISETYSHGSSGPSDVHIIESVTGRVTTKIDVFSFGVILMEIITGRKALDETQPEESMHLVPWFRRMWVDEEQFRKAIDPTIDLNEETLASVRTVAELAGHCCARDPHQRPDMGHAVNVLSSLAELWKPSEPNEDDIYGIDFFLSLPQAVKKWQALEESSGFDASSYPGSSDNTQTSIPTRPSGFADSFTSADGR
nr:receptor protein kinase TMK1-like [Ipomoea trifida]GMD19820.1 receptor protein kinase TMK1-like [Ipomoea batatas]